MARLKYFRLHPWMEGLEVRAMLSGASIANAIGESVGRVSTPREVDKTSAIVAPGNLTPRRRANTFALFVKAADGSGLQPRVVSTSSDQGVLLPLRLGRVAGTGMNRTTVAFTRTGRPGPLTTGVTGAEGTTGSYGALTTLVGDVNGDGKVDFDDVAAFAPAANSKIGDPNYLASADFNHNGVINLYDAKALMQNVQPLTKAIRQEVAVHLAPGDQPRWNATKISGASTVFKNFTIVGRTTPGSLIIEDNPKAELPGSNQAYKFSGPAHVADADGYFSFKSSFPNEEGLNNNDLLFLDPFGHQMIRALPVFWIPYAAGRIG